MKRLKRLELAWLEPVLPFLVLAVLAGFTYALFYQTPYAGIYFSPDGIISRVYVTAPSGKALRVDDQLVQVGPVAWADFMRDLRQPLFVGVKPGESIPLVIQRDEHQLTISWVFPGPTRQEVWGRFFSEFREWPWAYMFWLAGTVTLLFLRPKDERWRLLTAFNFLTALWLVVGGTLAPWHIWEGAIILRASIWLSVPVYWHLHWVFLSPLGRSPRFFWVALYLMAISMAFLEEFQIPPTRLYFVGLLLAMTGSVGLLTAHFLLRPEQRRDILRLLILWAMALLPPILLSLVGLFDGLPPYNGLAFFAFPLLPITYLYIAYRRQLGPHEFRANRLIALYLFLILLITALTILIPVAEVLLPNNIILIAFVAPIVSVIITILGFARFEHFIEQYVLRVPWPPERLLRTYAARITTSLHTSSLVNLLTSEVLPSLLVRQSALLHYDENRLVIVYTQSLEASQLPTSLDLPELLAQAGKYRALDDDSLLYPWVRLILPLSIGSEVIGLWLLGRRDPEDFYNQSEISTFKALADQTAIALTNIIYAERLHALYQTSIDQREAERASLGRELHDHILQQLFMLQENAVASLDSPSFVKSYETILYSVRHLIRGLRPPMLEFGLYRALAALTDDWDRRPDTQSRRMISLSVPENDIRYFPHAELHLYRIIQQAGENALRHAHAREIRIYGCLEPDRVDLTVEDDGVGFDSEKQLDLTRPEARSHFGLIGMQERAALINAQIRFDSALGQGTRVHIKWSPET